MAKRAAKKKKKTTARRRSAPKMDMLLVGSKVKQTLRNHDVNVASDAADSLNMVVHYYIDQAARRAAANGRKTVRGHDFHIG